MAQQRTGEMRMTICPTRQICVPRRLFQFAFPWSGFHFFSAFCQEPGQPRRASYPPLGRDDNIGADPISDTFHSQRSALFPWDMAGSSSSIFVREGGAHQLISDRMSVEHADARLRGSSASRRGSSLPSHHGSLQAGLESPAMILPAIQSDDDFVFDGPFSLISPRLCALKFACSSWGPPCHRVGAGGDRSDRSREEFQ